MHKEIDMRKLLALTVVFLMGTQAIFAQFVWSTAYGSGARIIPMSSVRQEVMIIYDQFEWGIFCWKSEVHFRDRSEFWNEKASAMNRTTDITEQRQHEQVLFWLNNYAIFVFATRGTASGFEDGGFVWGDIMFITFVIDNTVVSMIFSDVTPIARDVSWPTRNVHTRRLLEDDLDWLLAGFPLTQSPQDRAVQAPSDFPQTQPWQGRTVQAPVSPRTTASSPRRSNSFLMLGYNFSPEMPFGLTLGILGSVGFYASFNMTFDFSSSSGSSSGGSAAQNAVLIRELEAEPLGALEFTVGPSFNLIRGRLWLPVGIGAHMANELHITQVGNTVSWNTTELTHRRLLLEAGLQLRLLHILYLQSTFRLTGFSQHGFTLGAGLMLDVF